MNETGIGTENGIGTRGPSPRPSDQCEHFYSALYFPFGPCTGPVPVQCDQAIRLLMVQTGLSDKWVENLFLKFTVPSREFFHVGLGRDEYTRTICSH